MMLGNETLEAAEESSDERDEAFTEIAERHAGGESAGEESVAEDASRLSIAQKQFIWSERLYSEKIKPFLDRLDEEREAVIAEVGLGGFFQDDDGTVYHVALKKGKWVEFTHSEIVRTRRPGEKKGTLALETARAAGFEVK